MNIIIVGAGKVGRTLIYGLLSESKGSHNITVIDQRQDKVSSVTEEIDVQAIVGNGISSKTLKQADIDSCDLLIAVTGSDEQNLLCCAAARGALSKNQRLKTIARVRNPLYRDEIPFLQKELGINMIINPEQACANEIARIFQFPLATRVDTFSGKLELITFRLKSDSAICGQELSTIRRKLGFNNVVVCMITRGDEVIIPRGDFIFQADDLIGIISTPSTASAFLRKVGITSGKTRTAMLIGGSDIGYYLAERLCKAGISTKIIEQNRARCDELCTLLPEATIINGDGTDEKLLIQEGLENVNAFAALTGIDEENILVSLLARKRSSSKTVTKINRINLRSLLTDLHLDAISYPQMAITNMILQFVRSMNASIGSNVENLYQLEGGKAEALEFQVKDSSPVVGIPIKALKLKKNIVICAINRSGKVIYPGGDDTINSGDSVVIVTSHSGLHELSEILN